MSIELQIHAAALADLTTRSVRQRLRSTCLPAFTGFSIDHLEVVPGAAFVEALTTSVAVHLPVDVFIVTDAALFAAVNGTPIGATVPAARITLSFVLWVELKPIEAVNGLMTVPSVMTLAPSLINLGPLADVPGLNAEQIEQQLLELLPTLRLDLTPLLTRLGLPRPHTADVVLVDDVIAVRFNPSGAPQQRLFPGQDWGLFASSSTVERILIDRIEPPLMLTLPEARVSTRYEAVDGVPRVALEIDLTVDVDYLDLNIRLAIDLDGALSLIPRPAPQLRLAVDWSFHIFADNVPGFLEAIAENIAEGIAQDLIDPAMFGATPTGVRSFLIDVPLPALELPGVLLRCDSLLGSADGMTLGGAVVIAGLYEPPFKLSVNALAGPLRMQLCSQLARTGNGARSPEPPTIYNTTSFAQIELDGCGALCVVEQRTPAKPLAKFLAAPALGSPLEEATLRYAIPYFVAVTLAQPLALLVRTPRGVRFIDLGIAPTVQTDAAGVILSGARDYYIPDCLNVVPRHRGGYGVGWGMSVDDFKTRPLEEPDWAVYLQQAVGLIVQLVRVNGLDAGELLRFRSATHAIDVMADARGRAVVPVMLPLSAAVEPALLVRADGRSLEGHIDVDSAMFERHFTLPGKLRSGLAPTGSGGVRVATRARRQTLVHTLPALGAISRLATSGEETALNPQPLPPVDDGGSLAALNPQPLPPVDSPEFTRVVAAHAGLLGVERIVTVPGFSGRSAMIAILADGSKLLLEVKRSGIVRVAGTYTGPIGVLDLAGNWAVAGIGDAVAVFRVTIADTNACCGGSTPGRPAPYAERPPSSACNQELQAMDPMLFSQ